MKSQLHTYTAAATPRADRIYTTFRNVPELPPRLYPNKAVITFDQAKPRTAVAWAYLTSQASDTFIFNGEADLISITCILKWLSPVPKGRIVAVDMVLRKPKTQRARLMSKVRRKLWQQVDRFVHYFKDIRGFTEHYGIQPDNSVYVPFKSNIYKDAIDTTANAQQEGSYVFSAGRSLRDYTTLIDAARISGLPTAILFTSQADWAAHGTHVDLSELPPNVRLIADNGDPQGWLDGLKNARIVVVPTLPESLCASGIGTYLDAMMLKKPVIITRGPGADDVLNPTQAIFVPAQDPHALAQQMKLLWSDSKKAHQLAEKGHAYVRSLGDEQALTRRIFAAACRP